MINPQLQAFKESVKKFQNLQAHYSDEGAEDSEPSEYFARLLRKVFKGETHLKADPRGWEIFSDMIRSDQAVIALTAAYEECREAMIAVPLSEREGVQEILNIL